MKRTLVIVPFYNEAENLPEVLRKFSDLIKDDFLTDVLFVNDGSTDKWREIFDYWPRNMNRIVLIQHEKNRGVGAAFKTGLLWALHRCECYSDVVHCTANDKIAMSSVRAAISALRYNESVAAVLGNRFHPYGEYTLPKGRGLAIKVIRKVWGSLTGVWLEDVTCGLRAYRLWVLSGTDLVSRPDTDKYVFEYFLALKIVKGYSYTTIPVKLIYDKSRKKYTHIRPVIDYIPTLWFLIKARLRGFYGA